jgi:enamine deaminase RidA (YjgF/YER057c/UK114 family)
VTESLPVKRHLNPDGLVRSPAFSQVVVIEPGARLIVVGGQNGVCADGALAGEGLSDQVRQIIANIATALAAADADLSDVVSWDVRVVQGQDVDEGFAAFREAWGARPGPLPAITFAFVAAAAVPGALAEIAVLAAVPADR